MLSPETGVTPVSTNFGIDSSRGDSYDNAMAESIIGLYKTEVIRPRGPWRSLEDVEFATLEWVSWFNHHRLLEPISPVPPAEMEQEHYRSLNAPSQARGTQLTKSPEKPGRFMLARPSVGDGERDDGRQTVPPSLSTPTASALTA